MMIRYSLILLLIVAQLTGCKIETKEFAEGRGINCRNGMIVSAHPEASRIGAMILKKGGNAVDAAIATEFALAVCYPEAGNLGGGGFMLIRTADGKADVIDYREKAPGLATRDMYIDASGELSDSLSTRTHLASGVPGTVDGMLNAHSKYGKISFRDIIQPAIDLAKNGFAVTALQAADLNANRLNFISRNEGKTPFVKDSLWRKGDLLIQEDLSKTLEMIRDSGKAGFYSGRVADLLVSEMKRGNGIITHEDLTGYKSVSRQPIYSSYRNYRLITIPPPSGGGIVLLQLLKMTESYPIGEWGFNSVKTVHLIVEAERRAFADRSEHLGDPDYMKTDPGALLNMKYLESRMSDFDEAKATSSEKILPGSPSDYESEETTHYTVVDRWGNTVSATTTLNDTFGNSIVVQGAGFLLNNEMDDFSGKPGSPNMYGLPGGEVNSVAPGKKMLSSMTPVIVEKEGKVYLTLGSPGGSTIPTTIYQVITNVLDYGMSIQEAVDAGRFHHQWLPDKIDYEKQRFDGIMMSSLEKMGYTLNLRVSIGRVSAIMVMEDGSLTGGADRRGDNQACGY